MKNPPNIRQNFYQGQNVSATNLNRLQDYSDNTRNLVVTDILGYGIVSGFGIVPFDNLNFSIREGLAYTEHGVRLESTETLKINISADELPINNEIITKYLVISLDYDKSNIDKPITDSSDNAVYTEWSPMVKATLHLDKNSITKNDLPIIEVIISSTGITDIIKNGKEFLDFNNLIQKTSSFTTTKEGLNTTASIDAGILDLKALSQLKLEAPLVDFITQNFKINGDNILEMELETSKTGSYIKFSNGLLIQWHNQHNFGRMFTTWIYPIEFIKIPILLSCVDMLINFTNSKDITLHTSKIVYAADNSDSYFSNIVLLGFWKPSI